MSVCVQWRHNLMFWIFLSGGWITDTKSQMSCFTDEKVKAWKLNDSPTVSESSGGRGNWGPMHSFYSAHNLTSHSPLSIWPAPALDHSIINSPSFLTACEPSWLNVTFSLNYQNQEVPSIKCCVMARVSSQGFCGCETRLYLPCSTEVIVAI